MKNPSPELNKLKIAILQNMSVCTNNTDDFRDTIRNCTKAVEIDAGATKAIYLRSVAHMKLGDLDEAMADIRTAIKLSPADGNLRSQFEAIKKEKAGKAAKAKKGLAAFFAEGVYNEKDAVSVAQSYDALPEFKSEN